MNFRFLKIPVYIDPTYWIFLLFVIGTTNVPIRESILITIIITFSVLVHEYGHALAALFWNANPRIVLRAFGGVTHFNSYAITPKQRFLITLSGPMLHGLLILIPYILIKMNAFDNYYIRYVLYVPKYLNTILLLLNLIPIMPFDGGILMRFLLEKKFGRKGYHASIIIGIISAAIAIPCLLFYGYYFFFVIQFFLSGLHYCKLWQERNL